MSAGAVSAPPSPYKGLMQFEDSELDALLFFGRDRETEVIVANLMAARLTVLYGPTGVGKSSILRAGAAQRLRGEPGVRVVVCSSWTGDPVAGILDAAGAGGSLADGLAAAAGDGDLYLILDQFEEFFLYHGGDSGPGTLPEELADLLRRSGLRVNVLIALREDALAQLDAFKGRIPGVFGNFLRLDHLDRRGARAAIVGPVGRWNELVPAGERVEVEPELVEAVLDETATGRVDAGGAGRGTLEGAAEGRIETPYLQLVMERLWEAEREVGSRTLRLATLRRLGGAEAIVRDHLERALDALGQDEKDVAASVFNHLVTPSGTKIAHRAADLEQYAAVEQRDLLPVLAKLGRERIVRTVDGAGDGAERYEIFHDVLAAPVLAWRDRRELERRQAASDRRHRRLLVLSASSLVALAAVAAIAVYAFTQRSSARSQARHAHARELEAQALAQLPIDPQQSLLGALDATRLEPGPRSESVLREALVQSRLRAVLAAHGPVRAIAYSPDGRRLAAGGTDRRARVYDAASNRLLHVFQAGGRIAALAFSPDADMVATAADDGTAQLWDVRSGRLLQTLRHRGPVVGVAFAPDGSRVLTASRDGTAAIWRSSDGKRLLTLRHDGPVASASFDPRVALVATVAADREGRVRARLVDGRTGRVLRRFPERGLTAAVFSPDGKLLATTSNDGETRIHTVLGGRLVRTLGDGGGPPLDAAFSADGRFLATAGRDGGVRVWNLATGERKYFFVGHFNPVVHVAWRRDGMAVVSASLDRTARIWGTGGIEEGAEAATLTGHGDAVDTAIFSPDGSRVATASEDGTARVWDAALEQHLGLLGRHRGGAFDAVFSPDGRLVASAGADATARIWSAPGGALVAVLPHRGAVLDVAFSPDGKLVATASEDGTAALWGTDGTPGTVLRNGSRVVHVAFSRDGTLLATAGSDGVARIWSVPGGRLVAALRAGGPVADAEFSPDGSRVATASARGTSLWRSGGWTRVRDLGGGAAVRVAFSPDSRLVASAGAARAAHVWAARDGTFRLLLRGHKAPLTDIAFSRGGRGIVTASEDHDARTWNAATGAPERVLRGQFGTVTSASFSPDGRWVLTTGPLSAVLWSAETGQLLFFLRGHTQLVTGASFSPDSRHVTTSSLDGTVRLYTCQVCGDLHSLERLARNRLERSARALTPAERERYLGGR